MTEIDYDEINSHQKANAIKIIEARVTFLRSLLKDGHLSAQGRRVKRMSLAAAVDALAWTREQT